MRTTHTFAILEVTPMAFAEIKVALLKAGYDHAFIDDAIDMHGIALKATSAGPGIADIQIAAMFGHKTRLGAVDSLEAAAAALLDFREMRQGSRDTVNPN